jgi:hypothetical protein
MTVAEAVSCSKALNTGWYAWSKGLPEFIVEHAWQYVVLRSLHQKITVLK